MTLSHPIPQPRAGGDESLQRRADAAQNMLEHCTMCELRCGADRTRREPCPCGLGIDTRIYKRYVSLHEEADCGTTMRVFLGGCNFRCRFCDEGPRCFQPDAGEPITGSGLALELERVLDAGVKSISLIGGEPTLHAHTLLEMAAAAPLSLPLVLNSNMYMTLEVLELITDEVSEYQADFKFGNDDCARHLAGIPHYWDVVGRNLIHATRSTKVVVRHLLIPGHFDCCFRPIVDWMASNLPAIPFQLYTGYVPCWKASSDPTISRLTSGSEIRRASRYLDGAGLVDAEVMKAPPRREPSVTLASASEAAITVGADGRIYCHDLTPELATVVDEICHREPVRASRSHCDPPQLRHDR